MTKTKPEKTMPLNPTDLIEFKTLAEDAPVMLWLTNTDGDIIFSNTKWKQFVGSRNVAEKGGNAWYEALHPDDREECLKIFEDAFVSHDHFEMEYRLQRLDGEYRYVLDTGEPYKDDKGEFAGFIGSSTDITERKKSEQQLQRSHTEMSQYNIEMRLINKLNSYLQVCRTMEETHPVILYYARELFPSCSGSLYLLNENKTIVESAVSWGENTGSQLPVITSDDCWSLRQGKTHTVNDAEHGLVCKHLTATPEHGYTCVPIIAQGEMVGMLHLQFPKIEHGLSEEDYDRLIESRQRLVNMTADNLALALVSLKLREALEEQSIRDPLTKLYNRRYMEETIEREFSRCTRSKTELGILMLDIDHFKSYNDNYGHDAGDMVLVEFASLMRNKLRDSDIVCRFGGEEFMLIMPGAPLSILEQRAKQIRESLKELTFHYQGKALSNITTSIGIASFPYHGQNPKDLIKAADTALYQAKETGRDRAVVAKELKIRAYEKTNANLKVANGS
ncbi:MAG: diguanylate cyclase [Proteobacteria bacterium]|nr:GGDEF domain-containing protein [Pseudomonadota bacterium]NOG61182.1 diguanylate cyclase [Pseudomonadota bacterium]